MTKLHLVVSGLAPDETLSTSLTVKPNPMAAESIDIANTKAIVGRETNLNGTPDDVHPDWHHPYLDIKCFMEKYVHIFALPCLIGIQLHSKI
jgi:hypothetical protein